MLIQLAFAISSDFLNSPSTRITSPFSSTSVQRNRGSNAALAVCSLRELNMKENSDPEWSGRSPGCKEWSFFACLEAQNFSCHVCLPKSSDAPELFDEDDRDAPGCCDALRDFVRCFRAPRGSMAATSQIAACRVTSPLQLVVDNCLGHVLAGLLGVHSRRFAAGLGTLQIGERKPWLWLGPKDNSCDCRRRKRKRLLEGARDCSTGGIVQTAQLCKRKYLPGLLAWETHKSQLMS